MSLSKSGKNNYSIKNTKQRQVHYIVQSANLPSDQTKMGQKLICTDISYLKVFDIHERNTFKSKLFFCFTRGAQVFREH